MKLTHIFFPSKGDFMLRMFLRMILATMILVCLTDMAQAAGCGGGVASSGGTKFRPIRNFVQRVHDRRAARSTASASNEADAQSQADSGDGYNYGSQQLYSASPIYGAPVTQPVFSMQGDAIPLSSARKGDMAVFDGQTWRMVGTSRAGVPPCGCGCMTGAPCQCKSCFERTADPNWVNAPAANFSGPFPVFAPSPTWAQVPFGAMMQSGTNCANGSCNVRRR